MTSSLCPKKWHCHSSGVEDVEGIERIGRAILSTLQPGSFMRSLELQIMVSARWEPLSPLENCVNWSNLLDG